MAKIIKVNGDLEVKKADVVVRARYKLNPLSLKFITTLITGIKQSDNINEVYIFKVTDFQELMKLKRKDLYWAVKEALKELLEKPLYIPKGDENDNSFLMLNWVASAEYKEGEGIIEFEISNKLRPYLLEAKEKFLKYQLKNILSLKGSYTIRLYEILKDFLEMNKRYEKKAELIISVEELREMLEIPRSYRLNDIKRFILNKAKEELKKHTDITFDYEEIKRGRKVDKLKLIIQEKEEKKEETIEEKEIEIIDEKRKEIDFKNLKFKEFKKVLIDYYSGYYLGEYENKSVTLSESGYIELDGKRLSADDAFDVWEELFINRENLKPMTKKEIEEIKKQKQREEYLNYIEELKRDKIGKIVRLNGRNYEIIAIQPKQEGEDYLFKIIVVREDDRNMGGTIEVINLEQLKTIENSIVRKTSEETLKKLDEMIGKKIKKF
jgi:plasmid replication initiation protein